MSRTRILWPTSLFFGLGTLGLLGLARYLGTSWPHLSLMMVVGFGIWSLFEYVVHRFVNHSANGSARWNWDDHNYHHSHPHDVGEFVYTLRFSAPVGLGCACLGFMSFEQGGDGLSCVAGFWLGYLLYEWIHLCSHLPEANQPAWLWAWSATHRRHHISREPGNYGFITSLWDRVFGSYRL